MEEPGLWGGPPGILRLLDLAEEHRPAIEYDWRNRFGIKFDPPNGTDWGEACRLASVLLRDPSSALAASVAGWPHPVTREWVALKALYDRFLDVHAKRPAYMPAPWDPPPPVYGTTDMNREQVLAVLATQRGLPDNWTTGGGRE